MGAIPQLSVADLATHLAAGDVHLLDVRSGAEWRDGHISSALHVPLGYLTAHLADVPSDRPVVVQCRSGSRSAIAASLLRRLGRREVVNLAGGIDAWRAAGRPVSDSRDVAAPAADGAGPAGHGPADVYASNVFPQMKGTGLRVLPPPALNPRSAGR